MRLSHEETLPLSRKSDLTGIGSFPDGSKFIQKAI